MKIKMSKNFVLLVVVLGVLLVLTIVVFEFLAAGQAKRYPNRQAIRFYQTYSKQLHHLRDPAPKRWRLNEDPRNALYTIVREYSKENKTNILIQGDSWGEQFVDSKETVSYLSTLTQTASAGLVVAGVSSYAISPMTMQVRILRNDFHLHPNKIIAVIDQTDLGDEICRYNPRRRVDEDKRLVAVTPEPANSTETYSLTEFFEHSKIWSSKKLGILQYIDRALYSLTMEDRQKSPQRCTWSNIRRFLDGDFVSEEKDIFVKNLLGYIDEVFVDDGVKTLYFVTHPHRNHVDPAPTSHRYQVDVSSLIRQAVDQSKWQSFIQVVDFHVNFSQHYPNWELEDIFRKSDKASHLTDQAFSTVYSKYIFSKVISDDDKN